MALNHDDVYSLRHLARIKSSQLAVVNDGVIPQHQISSFKWRNHLLLTEENNEPCSCAILRSDRTTCLLQITQLILPGTACNVS